MKESQGRDVDVNSAAGEDVGGNGRRYRSPNRVLVRSFRISRDTWKARHQAVQVKLEQTRQLAADRDRSRDQWKQKCEVATTRAEQAEVLAGQRLEELEQARAQMETLQAGQKKTTNGMMSRQSVVQRPSV